MIAIGVFCAVVAAIGIYVAVGSDAISGRPTDGGHSAHARLSDHRHPQKAPVVNRTFTGAWGVESTATIAENKLPGTSAWRIAPGVAPGFIEGFADHTYASAGQQVGLYVSTSAPQFTVTGYRMGWYQGNGARQIWQSADVDGVAQPPCPVDTTVNMVSCDNWSKSLSLTIPTTFPSGDYLFKLVGSGGQQGYIMLTVVDPSSTATYVIMNRSLVEAAWNDYGGFDFYQGTGPCVVDTDTYPVCNRARVVSFDRPYAEGNGSADFFSNEYPVIELAEEHGLDVTYDSDVTVDAVPGVLDGHRVLVSLGHDEMWTNPERVAVLSAFARGMNLAFLSGSALVRHARLQPSILGPDREVVDYRNDVDDPLSGKGDPMDVTGNTWSAPPADWSSSLLVGEIYSGYLEPDTPAAAFVVSDASSWIYSGTGLQNGSTVPGIIESDIDHVGPPGLTPANVEVLGHSPVPLTDAYTNQGKWGPYTYSDLTYYTDPVSKAGVIDIGNNNWINALTPCGESSPTCPADVLAKITGNILHLFGQGPAGAIEPSTGNLQSVMPQGS